MVLQPSESKFKGTVGTEETEIEYQISNIE